ncbi:MAG: hypothetical protein H3C50_12175, partial [Kiritimatiellae bacterium]|nr:hypothetical protein [Kiritimatiellia bacterium]
GAEADAPYDVPELLAALAPKPTLVVTPAMDWQARAEDVNAAVDRAAAIATGHDAQPATEHLVPEDYNTLATPMQTRVIEWLQNVAGEGMKAETP